MFKYKRSIIILWIASILVNIKSIFTDFDVDSTYAITMSYRLLLGDGMFEKMWEPHQTSAIILTFLEWIYISIKGDVFGIAIYLQIMSVLIYGLCTYVLYKFLKEYTDKTTAHVSVIIFFAFRAKQIVLLEFSNLLIISSVFVLIFLVHYFNKKKIMYLYLCSIFLSLQVLSYPTSIVVFLIVIILILIYSTKKLRDCLTVVCSCFIMGCAYVSFFISKVGLNLFIENIFGIIEGDSSHLKDNFSVWIYSREIIVGILWLLGSFSVAFILMKINEKRKDLSMDKSKLLSLFGIIIVISDTVLLIFFGIKGNDDINFWFYVYGMLFLLLIFIGIKKIKYCTENQKYIYFSGISISFGTFIAVLMLTNLPIITAVNYLVLGAIVSLIPIMQHSYVDNREIYVFLLMICVAVIVHRGIAMRDYSKAKSLVFGIENIVREGPAAGIVCSYMSYYKTNSDILEWEQLIEEEDSLLIVTSGVIDPLLYMYKPVNISHYSTICTTTYDENLLRYWNKYPDKYPTVIAVECWYGDMKINPASWIMNWLQERYAIIFEGNYWRYYRLR